MRQSDRWLAVADLAGSPEFGLGPTRQLAILFALWPLGKELARRMAAMIPVEDSTRATPGPGSCRRWL